LRRGGIGCSGISRGGGPSRGVWAHNAVDDVGGQVGDGFQYGTLLGFAERAWTRSWATWNSTTGTDSYRLRATQARHHATAS
jgi:hypothetical protein